ncbi:MAG: hypothetical protein QM528_02890 [Phycisphaerales bacterium]|nr:hypothetical protein [Phycisphaerales bacterium]
MEATEKEEKLKLLFKHRKFGDRGLYSELAWIYRDDINNNIPLFLLCQTILSDLQKYQILTTQEIEAIKFTQFSNSIKRNYANTKNKKA